MRGHQVDARLDAYLGRLVEVLRERLGDRLEAVYAIGSVALGAYRPGRSDVDVLGLTGGSLPEDERLALARACSHSTLPCPARKLELVVMPAAVARAASAPIGWELNLNTGEGVEEHVGIDPAAEPGFWFLLDLAVAHEHSLALLGPPGGGLIGAPDRAQVEEAQAEAVAWFARHEPGPGALAAAARAWLWHETGSFAPKDEALRWAFNRTRGETSGPPAG